MQVVFDFLVAWLLNAMEVGAAVWVILRVFEKIEDIALKYQRYEKNRKASQTAEGAQ